MITNILGFGMPGGFEWIIMLIMGSFIFVIPICLFIWIIMSMLRANKERQRMRMEVSKIADELEKIRMQGD
jgi:uncharacterized membrane protein